MKIHYDKFADAVYFALKKARVAKTVELEGNMQVDLDKNGKLIGIEVLNYSQHQNSKKIKENIISGIPFTVTT